MKSLLSKLALVAFAGGAITLAGLQTSLAQSGRPNSTTMTCSQAQALITQRGAVVMSTGRYTFDRYVANFSYCQRGEYLRREFIPTKDNNKCFVQRCDPSRPFIFND